MEPWVPLGEGGEDLIDAWAACDEYFTNALSSIVSEETFIDALSIIEWGEGKTSYTRWVMCPWENARL